MKKLFFGALSLLMAMSLLTGCTDTISHDEKGNDKTEFSFGETATVNSTTIKINSVKKVLKECFLEYNGQCQSYTEPKNEFFLVIDLTIENTSDKELAISSLLSFELKTPDGEKCEQSYMLKSIESQLDGTVMSGDSLKGQIAYDVKQSNEYNFYYKDSLLDNSIKFIINHSDITE